MQLEYYIQGEEIPALYDWTLTVRGRYKLMYPQIPLTGVIQIVLESADGQPTPAQKDAIEILLASRPKGEVSFFGGCFADFT